MRGSNSSSEVKKAGVFGAVAAVPIGLLMVVAAGLLETLLFLSALNENFRIPAIGAVSGDRFAELLDSWYPYAIVGVLAAMPLLLLVLSNLHRIRRAFLAAGASAVISAVLSITAGISGARAVRIFPPEWQDVLVNATAVWKDLSFVCGIILIAAGAASLSVYASITAVKGGRHEKDT